jgi:hypothetical protein
LIELHEFGLVPLIPIILKDEPTSCQSLGFSDIVKDIPIPDLADAVVTAHWQLGELERFEEKPWVQLV